MRDLGRMLWAFFVRDATLATSYRVAFAMSLAGSIGKVLILWLPAQILAGSNLFASHGGFLPFSLVGMAMMAFFMVSYQGLAGAVRSEQAFGTLEALLMTPASVPSIVVGSNLWNLAYALFDSALILTVGWLAFGVALRGDAVLAFLIVFLTSLSFAAVGIFSAAFVVVFKRGDPFRILVGGASFLLGGVVYPVEVLPSWVGLVSRALPITHGARALRAVLLDGKGFRDVAGDLIFLAIFAAVALPLGVSCFAAAVRRAKRDGTLLQY